MYACTGPPKVEGVMFGNNIVENGRIHQEIKWNVPLLRYNVFQHYIIRFTDSLQALLNKMDNRAESEQLNTTLQLDFHSSNITYYVHVAVKSTKERGDFSDPVSITYTSEYTQFDLLWYNAARFHIHTAIRMQQWCKYIYTLNMCHTTGDFSDPLLLNHTAPGPPQHLTIVNRTCHSIAFQWSPPDDTGRLDVTGYDILHNGTSVATITGTVYTLEGLTPDTVHTISARTRNAIGASVLQRTLTAATGGRGIRTCTCICTVALIHCRSTIQYMCTSMIS